MRTRGSQKSAKIDAAPSAVPDVLGPGLDVVFCGINPGRVSAAAAAHFANPRNDFWRLLHAAGFTSRQYEPSEQFEVLKEGIGLTNAAARTTKGSSDLRRSDFAGSAERLDRLARELQPGWIGFVGKEAYRGTLRREGRARPAGARGSARPACSCFRRRHLRTRPFRGRSANAGFASSPAEPRGTRFVQPRARS